ncbi:AMP-dependent synthetase/ligase protein (plasmid) [Rhizobium gallicum]|uniref:AMP-dependent synthetase/ligase protein n=1 Tax=Rhizobium gallicum TaxID=56730 RepID=A0A1L5NRZ5_9HYPH|nr:class I adenylate-forming enzyme family protein [Rhizobium gallicum]APO70675.1 AMP-dependent synthetase/ligase protein [Rhizobium gallicum]
MHTGTRAFDPLVYWAIHSPEALAICDSQRQLSFEQMRAGVEEMAAFLRQRGVGAADRVLIVSDSGMSTPLLIFAAQSVGAWPAVVNAWVSSAEIASYSDLIDPKVTFLLGQTPSLLSFGADRNFVEYDSRLLGSMHVHHTIGSHRNPEVDREEDEKQIALILFTSGTTGRPKAAMLSHSALLSIGSLLAKLRFVRPGVCYNSGGPLSHIMGIGTLMSVMVAGASVRIMPRLDPGELVQQVAEGKVTHLSLVPTAYLRMLEQIRKEQIDVSHHALIDISVGGAPLDSSTKEAIENCFGLALVAGYGMTECSPISRTDRTRTYDANSIGYPVEGVRTRVVTDDGHDAPFGTVGELWAKSAGSFSGYYGDHESTRYAMRDDGWFATGDLVREQPDGELIIVGRKKEMIIRSGFNVYPAEVEGAINEYPGVLQSAVVGRPTADSNEEVLAFIQTEASALDKDEIIAFLRRRIAPYKVPSRFFFMSALPIGQNGKILKRKLLEEVENPYREQERGAVSPEALISTETTPS